jgi:predicted CDP-diglyceride synthetase/phosphatidate cytidylyltransferase
MSASVQNFLLILINCLSFFSAFLPTHIFLILSPAHFLRYVSLLSLLFIRIFIPSAFYSFAIRRFCLSLHLSPPSSVTEDLLVLSACLSEQATRMTRGNC